MVGILPLTGFETSLSVVSSNRTKKNLYQIENLILENKPSSTFVIPVEDLTNLLPGFKHI
jgi:hypothetical protein